MIQRSDAKFYTPVFKSYHIIESLSVNSFPRLMSQGKVFSNKYTRKTARVSQPALFNGKQDNTEMNSNDQWSFLLWKKILDSFWEIVINILNYNSLNKYIMHIFVIERFKIFDLKKKKKNSYERNNYATQATVILK